MSNKLKDPEAPQLSDLTTCIHCGQKFSHPRITVIGEPSARLESYLKGLSKHIGTKHPELGQQMVAHGAAFMELLFLLNFRTTDPELSEQQDRVRWQVHQQTLKARYPDENLKEQARSMARLLVDRLSILDREADGLMAHGNIVEEAFAVDIADAFRSIRDALEEPNKYSAPVPQSPKVLV